MAKRFSVFFMTAVLSMIAACVNAQEPKATYHDLISKMDKIVSPVAKEKVAGLDKIFKKQLDSLEVGKGMTDGQRSAKAKELAGKFYDEVILEMSTAMVESMAKHYVALDTLEEYVNAFTAEPIASIAVKVAAVKAEVMESVGVAEALGLDIDVVEVACPDDYRKNFEKVYACLGSSNMQNKFGQNGLGTDVFKHTEELMKERILAKCVGTISPAEMEQYAAFTELPCTKAFYDGMAKAGNAVQAVLLSDGNDEAQEGVDMMIEIAACIADMPKNVQQWLDKNLPGAKFENLNLPQQ